MVDDWDDTVSALPGVDGHEVEPEHAYLIVLRGNNVGQTHRVVTPDMVIGRAPGADLRLNDEGVSRFHCKVRHDGNYLVIEDLGSRNGTFCNGERVVSQRVLSEGDRLQIGTTCVLRFTYVESDMRPTPIPEQGTTQDPLTGLHSRRYFLEQLERAIAVALGERVPLSLGLIYIDRFSEFRRVAFDADEITIRAAEHIRRSVQHHNLVARIADGEFAMMMRSMSPGDAFMLAERLRASTGSLDAATTEGAPSLTFSIGIAALGEVRAETAHEFLLAAGGALQRARSLGGNRVIFCTQELLLEPRIRTKG